jgi:outer membrane protein TolC
MNIPTALLLLFLIGGCVSDTVSNQGIIPAYQETLAARGPQERAGTEGLEPVSPAPDSGLPGLKEMKDDTGRTTIELTLEDAVARALANSPELTTVSFDPSIAKDSLTVAASEFDVTLFGEADYNKNDTLSNDISQSTRTHSSSYEAGIKQKGITGAEWRLAYALTRSFDESINRRFETSYEPVMTFEIRQPLLRDAWLDVNLAGVNISKLNYRIALTDFRQKAEDISTQVISLYWRLLQARRNVEIQQSVLDMTIETLRKVENRKKIDATMGDIKQAEASAKSREADLFETRKSLADVQDQLVRLLADHQMKLVDNVDIVPVSSPDTRLTEVDQTELLRLALKNNPDVDQAKLKVEVAEINVKVAKQQRMPRLDIFGTTQLTALSDSQGETQEMLSNGDYANYSFGLTLEYPLGNREKNAEFRRRKLQHAKALSHLNNISDQVATHVKERLRSAETAHKEIQVWGDAVNAARIHLQSLDDILRVRKKLTPEYLLTKIQAQDSLAKARRSEMKATVDYNIALARLYQAVGTVLDIRSVKKSLPVSTGLDKPALVIAVEDNEIDKRTTSELHQSSQAQKVKKEDRSPDVTIISSKAE